MHSVIYGVFSLLEHNINKEHIIYGYELLTEYQCFTLLIINLRINMGLFYTRGLGSVSYLILLWLRTALWL